MLTQTMVHNSIEDAKKAIRQNLESRKFDEVLLTVQAWIGLKELEEKLKSGSIEETEARKQYDFNAPFCQPIYNPDKRLEDIDVTVTDTSDELDKARALIKKYVLEDKRELANVVSTRAFMIDLEATHNLQKVKDNINSLYQKEFEAS